MNLTLSNEKIGTPSRPEVWDRNERSFVQYDIETYEKEFLARVTSLSTSAIYQCDNLNTCDHYHFNYMEYLYKCWSDHLGVVISPDILWYSLLCEVASLIKEDPEEYRHLFSTSSEKQEISIPSGDPVVMPLSLLTAALSNVVPTDTDTFFPEFTTQTPRSLHAFQAAFCDICRLYYNYSMYLCNIPKINVQGTLNDWKNLLNSWKNLPIETEWTQNVTKILDQLIANFHSKEFWKSIFSIKHCGSGGQIEVLGWFSEFFRNRPKIKYVENFSNHVSIIKYKQLNLEKDYAMSVGLFTSKLEDDFMIPNFGFVVCEIV